MVTLLGRVGVTPADLRSAFVPSWLGMGGVIETELLPRFPKSGNGGCESLGVYYMYFTLQDAREREREREVISFFLTLSHIQTGSKL